MDFYIPDVLLDDYERMARGRVDRMARGRDRLVPIQANVLLGLIRMYRNKMYRNKVMRASVDAAKTSPPQTEKPPQPKTKAPSEQQ